MTHKVASTLISFALLAPLLLAQQRPSTKSTASTSSTPAPAQQGGAATGGEYAPVKDAQHRPITAGGFVEGAPTVFVNVAEKAGLASFHHKMGTPEKQYIIE